MRFKICVWFLLGLALLSVHDFRPSAVALAISPYEFRVVGWELGNLPDKWVHRAVNGARSFLNSPEPGRQAVPVQHYFQLGKRVQEINRQVITLQAGAQPAAETSRHIAELRREREELTDTRDALRPEVEETLESAVADTLQELGFKAWTGVFPPVDTALTGSPTVLILSPRERIERIEGGLMRTGIDNDARERIEAQVETDTELSALVANTGGIALYPSIVSDSTQLEYALEVIAHEWVHQWLWFRPLGRRYFESGELTALNETVATIAGIEIGQLARHRLEGTEPQSLAHPYHAPTTGEHNVPGNPARFDFQAEMRATRVRVDELLAAGDVDGAEAYMEARRRIFVAEGYPIRKLNQAYFAFHGAYGTTGAAGVSIIGEQVLELRRRSPSLAEFLRTAAQLTSAAELTDYVERAKP